MKILGAPVVKVDEPTAKYTCNTCLGIVNIHKLGPHKFFAGLASETWQWTLGPAGLRRIGHATLTIEEAAADADRVLSEIVKRARAWDPTKSERVR